MTSAESSPSLSSLAPLKPISISLSSKSKPNISKPSNAKPASASPSRALTPGTKRPHSALAEPDSDAEDDAKNSGRHEAVVGFGQDGKAISVADVRNQKLPLVIKSEKNRDWREESRQKRGKRNLLPQEVQALQNGLAESGDRVTVGRSEVSTEGGLKIVPQKKERVDRGGDTIMEDVQTNGVGKDGEKKTLTVDEEAIAALLGQEKKSTFTIPSADNKEAEMNGHDTDAYTNDANRFRADVDSRPPPASLADYAAVPIEEFGAAILRGLGWKEGDAAGKSGQAATPVPREVKRRPAFLGLGAKETPGGIPGEELGTWNQKKGKGRDRVAYNPVMLRNSVTGEMVTEEEMELRKVEARQGKGNDGKEGDWRDRRDRNLRLDEEKKKERLAIRNGNERSASEASSWDRQLSREGERRNDRGHGSSRRERTRSRERSKDGSSRRERSRSKERKHRRRDDNDDYDRRNRDRVSDRRDKDKDYNRRDRHREHRRH